MSLLSVADVAAELNVPVRTAYTLMRRMRHVRLGRLLRVSRASLAEWLAEQTSSGDSAPTGRSPRPGGRTSAGAAAGIPEVSTNGLRRTFGMWHRLEGYSLDVLSKLFGHTTATLVRDVYAHVDGEELRAAMEASRGAAYRNGTGPARNLKKRRQKAA